MKLLLHKKIVKSYDDFLNKLFKDLDIKFLRVPVQSFYNMEELRNKIKESI